MLNRAIVMKYTPRPGRVARSTPSDGSSRPRSCCPSSRNDLSLGSFSSLVGQKDFSRTISRHLNGAERLSERDERVLGLIDELPTLDPFLLYALLKSHGLDISPVYFQLSEADRQAIQQQMAQAFAPLVQLCLPDGQVDTDGAKTFVDKILNFEESEEIDSLRAAFRLSPELFAVAMFAWRGIIYYKWRSGGLHTPLGAAAAKIRALKLPEAGAGVIPDHGGEQSRTKILRMAATAAARVQEINTRYDVAFADFVNARQADQFRQFLISAPSLFLICGQSLAIIEQVINFADAGPHTSPREALARRRPT